MGGRGFGGSKRNAGASPFFCSLFFFFLVWTLSYAVVCVRDSAEWTPVSRANRETTLPEAVLWYPGGCLVVEERSGGGHGGGTSACGAIMNKGE